MVSRPHPPIVISVYEFSSRVFSKYLSTYSSLFIACFESQAEFFAEIVDTSALLMADFPGALRLVKMLRQHKNAWPFNEPVDPVALNIPDYFQVVTHPMDLGTIEVRRHAPA